MNPQQPPDEPQRWGQPPGGPYPPQGRGQGQGPEQYGGRPPGSPASPGTPARMPGTAITVRVLMFIGGVVGVLLAFLLWGAGVLAVGGGQVSQDFLQGMQDAGLHLNRDEAGVLFGLAGAVTFVYGALSIGIASFMSRRSPVVLWSVVVFQVLAGLILLVFIVTGGYGSIIPLLFAIAMIVLMLLAPTRAYYTKPAADPYAGQ